MIQACGGSELSPEHVESEAKRFQIVAIDQPCACMDLTNAISVKLASTYFARCEGFASHCVAVAAGLCTVNEYDVRNMDVPPPTGLDRVQEYAPVAGSHFFPFVTIVCPSDSSVYPV